ncbi:MAG: DUF1853 family protein [Betaproteobacteria bacterium]|nr:DUF1853 family protein [Betaproteobacteria bacterium]
MRSLTTNHQAQFQQRWVGLRNPHVRSLAWLLDAPDVLDAISPRWQGKIAKLPTHTADHCRDWLLQLDADAVAFEAYLDVQRFTRLGRYAERLLAWYFKHQGQLVAHGLPVRSGKEDTIGEFDFLLRFDQALVHWELATKFYLLAVDDPVLQAVQQADYFVGPNLADTLGRKMRKILDRQLALGEHPAAQALLPQPLATAQALVKGWLFHRRGSQIDLAHLGVSEHHCQGWWCTLNELEAHLGSVGVVLPRTSWLAPARLRLDLGVDVSDLKIQLHQHFEQDNMPLMVASLRREGDEWFETERGFVVPDAWPQQAVAKING